MVDESVSANLADTLAGLFILAGVVALKVYANR